MISLIRLIPLSLSIPTTFTLVSRLSFHTLYIRTRSLPIFHHIRVFHLFEHVILDEDICRRIKYIWRVTNLCTGKTYTVRHNTKTLKPRHIYFLNPFCIVQHIPVSYCYIIAYAQNKVYTVVDLLWNSETKKKWQHAVTFLELLSLM